MSQRAERLQREIVEKYDRVSNLYVAYVNSGKLPDVFGREFFHAIGDILQGMAVKNLTLYHLGGTSLPEVVDHMLSKGGTPGTRTETRKSEKRSPADRRRKARDGARKLAARQRTRNIRNNP